MSVADFVEHKFCSALAARLKASAAALEIARLNFAAGVVDAVAVDDAISDLLTVAAGIRRDLATFQKWRAAA